MPTDHGVRSDDRQCIIHLGKQSADTSQYQSVNRDEGKSLGTGSPQHIDLLPQDQNFCLKRNSRPQQIDHHPTDQSAQIQHRAAASPNSRSTASRIGFAIGTTVIHPSRTGYDRVPDDHAGFLALCQKLKAAGKPAGFALGNAVGDGNGFANWLLWSHNASLLDEEGNVIINSKETVAALKYLKELYPTFIVGTPSWNDVSNNRAYSAQEIALTFNGVSLYFALKNDPATKAIADDTEHQLIPKGLAPISPMGGLTLNAMVFKHTSYPNAAKAFLQFMLEKEQYEPWLNANSGYWSHPLAAYADAAVWSGDPKVKIFKDVMKSQYYSGYKGPISTATGAVNADYVLVQMCASVATDAGTPEAAAAEAERRAKRYFRR